MTQSSGQFLPDSPIPDGSGTEDLEACALRSVKSALQPNNSSPKTSPSRKLSAWNAMSRGYDGQRLRDKSRGQLTAQSALSGSRRAQLLGVTPGECVRAPFAVETGQGGKDVRICRVAGQCLFQ